jgi:hypothetical protein
MLTARRDVPLHRGVTEKHKSLMDLFGSIRTGRPSLGIKMEREIAGRALGEKLERKAKRAEAELRSTPGRARRRGKP